MLQLLKRLKNQKVYPIPSESNLNVSSSHACLRQKEKKICSLFSWEQEISFLAFHLVQAALPVVQSKHQVAASDRVCSNLQQLCFISFQITRAGSLPPALLPKHLIEHYGAQWLRTSKDMGNPFCCCKTQTLALAGSVKSYLNSWGCVSGTFHAKSRNCYF